MLWWQSLWWKHRMLERPIGKDTRLTHGWMHKWWWTVAHYWKLHKVCTNDSPLGWERQLETAFCALFKASWFMKEVKTRLSIPELIKRDDGRFSCSVSHTTGVKAKYGLGNEWRLGTKTANEWNTQQYCVRWGEKYFQFWVNAICESYLGLYFSGMGIFEKFQFLAKSSLAIDWFERWLSFLKVRSSKITLMTNLYSMHSEV